MRAAGARQRAGRKRAAGIGERIVERGLLASGLFSVVTTAAILAVLVYETAGFFGHVSPARLLLDTQWTPLFSDKHFGIWPLVAGTLLTTLVAVCVALPMGLLAAIYLSEFAPERLRQVLKPALEVLAGVPTIIYGYFALVTLTPFLQRFVPGLAGFNALSPGLVMGIMIIPMVSSLSEDALRAVPAGVKEGALALGASRLKVVWKVTVPTALSGISAAVVLALSRAIGETMIVAIAAGQRPTLTVDPRVPIETMTAYIVQVSLGDTPAGTLEYRTIFVVGAALFAMTFCMNVIAQRLGRRFRGRYES
ncbi:MAG: phosphate ABC transporter permease subunit PstC [Deltaproteobacteria bacterium]|nr:MAG: phosphate ABC transporter permease subunit PstC [Deltaproteobacteria bacterium]